MAEFLYGRPDVNCEEVAKLLHEYLDHQIDEASRLAIQSHLAICTVCHCKFEFEGGLRKVVCDCVSCEVPIELRDKIRRALEQES